MKSLSFLLLTLVAACATTPSGSDARAAKLLMEQGQVVTGAGFSVHLLPTYALKPANKESDFETWLLLADGKQVATVYVGSSPDIAGVTEKFWHLEEMPNFARDALTYESKERRNGVERPIFMTELYCNSWPRAVVVHVLSDARARWDEIRQMSGTIVSAEGGQPNPDGCR